MKKNFLVLVALCVLSSIFYGCSKSATYIEYVPCKVEKNEDWSFVDAKGNVFCRDAFKQRPSFVNDGLFSVSEDKGYCLYKFDKKKPTVILEDLKSVGYMSDGLMPIVRTDGKIEIINAKGKTQFVLDRINNKPIVSCYSCYVGNFLCVQDADKKLGCVDRKGKVLIAPEYDVLLPISKDLLIAVKNEEGMIINKKGEKVNIWTEDELNNIQFETLLVNGQNERIVLLDENERLNIYNLKGNLLFKCPSRVKSIIEIKGDYFVYESEEGCGVMNLKGDRIVNDKYESIKMVSNGYIARKDKKHDAEYINIKGELISKIPDLTDIKFIGDFMVVGIDDNDEYVLDNNMQPINKDAYYYIPTDMSGLSGEIKSDYVDVDYIVEHAMNAIGEDLNSLKLTIGNSLSNIPYFTQKDRTDGFSRSTKSFTATYNGDEPPYSTKLKMVFDRTPTVPIYKTREVERYGGWYYGYYTTTESYVSGYKVDQEACIKSMTYIMEVSKEKKHTVLMALRDAFDKNYDKVSEDTYKKGDIQYVLSDNKSGDVQITMQKNEE